MDRFATLLELLFLLPFALFELLAEQFVMHVEGLVNQFFFGREQKGDQRRITSLIIELVQPLSRHPFPFSAQLLEAIVMKKPT